jgi:hypothetical protein
MDNSKNRDDRSFAYLGGAEDRIVYFCTLFKLEIPALEFDEYNKVLVTDSLLEWVAAHNGNLEWLLTGSPEELLRTWDKRKSNVGYIIEQISKMEHKKLVTLIEKIDEMDTSD